MEIHVFLATISSSLRGRNAGLFDLTPFGWIGTGTAIRYRIRPAGREILPLPTQPYCITRPVMNELLQTRLDSLSLAEPQRSGPFAVIPLLDGKDARLDYLTLSQALSETVLAVSEVSEGGSVPDLLVRNRGDRPVLLLDGEEVAGAKQNRILNTSILVAAVSTIKVPVSCTEQGRWAYSSPTFGDSGYVTAHKIRYAARESVQANLSMRQGHRSDQGRVWREIRAYHDERGIASPTGAMRDAMEQDAERVRVQMSAFPALPNQVGLLVLAGEQVLGLDVLSRPQAYALVHPKLLLSYVGGTDAPAASTDPEVASAAAKSFLKDLGSTGSSSFPSPGLGEDIRFTGSISFGSGLALDGELIHLAAFRRVDVGSESGPKRMAGFERRRGFRMR